MHVVRHYHISANGDVEFPLSVGSKSYESAMHVILREPFSTTVSAKGDEVERPRVKEPLQTGWPPRKVSLHEKSCIAKQSSSSSTVSCSHRPVAHHRSVPVATGRWLITALGLYPPPCGRSAYPRKKTAPQGRGYSSHSLRYFFKLAAEHVHTAFGVKITSQRDVKPVAFFAFDDEFS